MRILLHILLVACFVIIISYVVPGIYVTSFWVALLVALVLGIINVTIKPLLFILTLPITILTLGLFTFVINALVFALAAWIVPGFTVTGFWAALLGSLILSIFRMLTNRLESVKAQ